MTTLYLALIMLPSHGPLRSIIQSKSVDKWWAISNQRKKFNAISTDEENTCDKVKHLFTLKRFQKNDIHGNLLNWVVVLPNPTANIIRNGRAQRPGDQPGRLSPSDPTQLPWDFYQGCSFQESLKNK